MVVGIILDRSIESHFLRRSSGLCRPGQPLTLSYEEGCADERRLAQRAGYDDASVDALPDAVVDSFAGVANLEPGSARGSADAW